MSPDKKSARSVNHNTPVDKSITIAGDVKDGVVIVGDNNVVTKTTIIQKFFNIFKSDSETLEQRNRRILLGHVENAWIKGVLDASLHGAALLDLGIKQDPEAVTKYPWAIKKESTDETLPAGTSMLEIFDSIGMGRSLLILGAPGSGKTTMLLELARGLIARAREDITQPIPMVFNLASWTEKLPLADWLVQELNNLYSVPRKTAPDWVQGNKLLLLLDGLDEVRQESRAKCVEAINAFRKEHGMTSLAVCSRSQDYADLNAKLSFEGAIEVQPLTQEQITEFFNRFGDEMAGIKQALEKDSALREMAETPLFLSIMLMAYRNKQDVEILVSGDEKARRKYLFDTYIEQMFKRPRLKSMAFKEQDILQWLSWLATKMITHNAVPYWLENMQPEWLSKKKQGFYGLILGLIFGLVMGLGSGIISGLVMGMIFGLIFGLFGRLQGSGEIKLVDTLFWDWRQGRAGLIMGLITGFIFAAIIGLRFGLSEMLLAMLSGGLIFGPIFGLYLGLTTKIISQTTYPGQRVSSSIRIYLSAILLFGLVSGLIIGLIGWLTTFELSNVRKVVLSMMIFGLVYGGFAIIQHYTLRLIIAANTYLPWRLIPFLDHCVDLIFLRRVGGGYIFVHRLLMEHFAEMYVETTD